MHISFFYSGRFSFEIAKFQLKIQMININLNVLHITLLKTWLDKEHSLFIGES